MKLSNKTKMLAAILAIAFVAYNMILFIATGFDDYTAVFWLSWSFMLLAFAAMAGVGVVFGKRGMSLRDWLFGYPLIKHTTIYIVVAFVLSSVFIALEQILTWQLAFVLQFVVVGIYLIFAISCFLSKETIEDVNIKISDKTRFIKMLQVDAEMMVEKCSDSETKSLCQKLAEEIRYSDPMSNNVLFELEKDIALTISECSGAIDVEDFEKAKELCQKANLLLVERNKKCKALK